MARQLKHWIKTYMEYTSVSEAPDAFHFWTAVSTIAGALRRKVHFNMGQFQWTPNFYIIFVAPPGIVTKSTTFSIGMSILREVPDVKFGPDVITWQALTQTLAASRLDIPIGGAFQPMCAMTIFSSELGTFFNPHDREMVDVLVDLWDNRTGTWEKITKTSGSDQIVNPWINIAACTTPAWIAGNFPEYMMGGGFTSRCIFVYADRKKRLIAYPFLEMPPEKLQEYRTSLLNDLKEIAKLGGEFKLSKEAIETGQTWYNEHYEKMKGDIGNEALVGYISRKQAHIHKLAMILSAAEADTLIISKTNLEQAIAITTSLEADMPKVFAKVGTQGDSRNTVLVLELIKGYGKINKQQLFRMCASRMGIAEFDNAIGACVATGFIQVYSNGIGVTYVYTPDKVEGAVGQSPDSIGADSGNA